MPYMSHHHWSLDFAKALLLDCPFYKGLVVNNQHGMFAPRMFRPVLLKNGWTWVRRETILGISPRVW